MLRAMLLTLLSVSAAQADVQALIQLPPPASIYVSGHTTCAASGFTASDGINGTCRTAVSGACSGRGCQPVTTYTYYITRWDVEADATAGDACYAVRHHLPQADQYTYLNGHTPADCPFLLDTQDVIEVSYQGFDYPFWYVSSSADGLYELVNSNAGSMLVQF